MWAKKSGKKRSPKGPGLASNRTVAHDLRMRLGLRVVGAALALGAVCVLLLSCSSSSNGASGTCSASVGRCPHGCSPGIGCLQCASNGDCAGRRNGPICVASVGRCGECASAADCGTARSCDPATLTCVTACTSDAQCPAPAPHCDSVLKACIGCRGNSDCGAGRPLCSPLTSRCAACITNADCGVANPACDTVSGQCVQCLVDADC